MNFTQQHRNRLSLTVVSLVSVLGGTACPGGSDPAPDAAADAAFDAPPADATFDAQTPDATFDASFDIDAGPDLPCSQPIPCPSPAGDRFMICGQLLDVETTLPVVGSEAAGLRVAFYDALAIVQDPSVQPEFTVAPDSCGRFRSIDPLHQGVRVPATSFLVIGIDDGQSGNDDHALTGIVVEGVQGDKRQDVRTYVTRKTTAAAWGNDLVAQGAFLGVFIDTAESPLAPYPGLPVAGVELRIDGQAQPLKDFYFDDASPLTRASVARAAVTGANGSAVGVAIPLTEVSGAKAGCTWPSLLSASLPGTVFVSEFLGTCL